MPRVVLLMGENRVVLRIVVQVLACRAVVVLGVRELGFAVAWLGPSLEGMLLALLLSRMALGNMREA